MQRGIETERTLPALPPFVREGTKRSKKAKDN